MLRDEVKKQKAAGERLELKVGGVGSVDRHDL